jgi:hypothetical protein
LLPVEFDFLACRQQGRVGWAERSEAHADWSDAQRVGSALRALAHPTLACVDDACVAPVHRRERAAQAVVVMRHQDEMHVVRHQAPGPHGDVSGAAMLGQQVAVERVVRIGKEGAGAAVAALGDVVRMTGDDDAGEAGHRL